MYLSRRAQRLLDLIEWFSSTCQHIFPSQRTLAGYLKCSVRTVKRALAELRGQLVAVRRRYRRSNVYRLLGIETAQMGLFSTEEIPLEISTPILPVPKGGPTVVVRNSEPKPKVFSKAISRETLQHPPRKDADLSSESETERTARKVAGMERLSEGDRRYLRELERSGASQGQIRAGIALGRARAKTMANPTQVRSLRYYGATIEEAKGLPSGYLDYVQNWLERHAS